LHAYNLLTNEAAVKDMTGSASTDATTLAKYLGAAILIPLAAYNIISSYVPHAVQRRFGIVNLLSALYCTVVWWYTMNHETQMFKVPILGWLILAALSAYAVFHDGNLSLPQLTFTKSPVSYFALVGAVVSIVFGFQLVLGDGRQFWSDLGLKHDGAVAQLSRFWGLFLQPRLAVAWLTTTTLPRSNQIPFGWHAAAWWAICLAGAFALFDRSAPMFYVNVLIFTLMSLGGLVATYLQQRGATHVRGKAATVAVDDDADDDDIEPVSRGRSKSPARSKSSPPATTTARGKSPATNARSKSPGAKKRA